MKKKIRIKDIASKAGVSTGTVDRVIHGRGNVSPKKKKRVLEVMKELGYKKNILASTLAFNKELNIAAIMPDPNIDPYWEGPNEGINQAQETIMDFGVTVKKYWFNMFIVGTFIEAYKQALEKAPDAILLAPIFQKEARKLLKIVKEKKIPIILINTYIDDDYPLSYIGQDSYHSGYLGGRLLSFNLNDQSQALILNLGEEFDDAKHLMRKAQGFIDYFSDKNNKVEVVKEDFSDFENQDKLRKLLQNTLNKYPRLEGIYVTTSRAYKIIDVFPKNKKNISIVGFDLLNHNIKYLLNGKISFLINQHPVEQGRRGISSLFKHLVLKEDIEKLQFLPLDIVVEENYKFYLEE